MTGVLIGRGNQDARVKTQEGDEYLQAKASGLRRRQLGQHFDPGLPASGTVWNQRKLP